LTSARFTIHAVRKSMQFGIHITVKSPIGKTGKVGVPEFANWLELVYQSVLDEKLVQVFQGYLSESQFQKLAQSYGLQAGDILTSMTDVPCPDATYLCPYVYKFASAKEQAIDVKVMAVVGTDSKYEIRTFRDLNAEQIRDHITTYLVESDSAFDLFAFD